MARPRNKIAMLPLELRLDVAQMLADRKTYDEIREELLARGVKHEELPHNSSFLAYQEGEEYKSQIKEMIDWRRSADRKKKMATALELGGGASGVVDLAIYQAASAIEEFISRGELDASNIARTTYALRALKTTLIDEAEGKYKTEVEELKAKLAKGSGTAPGKGGLSQTALEQIEEKAGLL